MNQFPGTNYHDLNLNWLLGQMKNCLAEWETTKGQWTELAADNAEFKDFVTNYLTNLDLTQEVSDKINAMVEDGTLIRILTEDEGDGSPLSDTVGTWLAAHITQETGYVVDNTLTVSGAAADAKATGNTIDVNLDISYTYTDGAYVATNGNIGSSGPYRYSAPIAVPANYKVVLYGAAGNLCAAIAECDANLENIVPKVNGLSGSEVKRYEYVTTSNTYIVVSFNRTYDHSVSLYGTKSNEMLDVRVNEANTKIVNLTEELTDIADFQTDIAYTYVDGEYIAYNGSIASSGAYRHSNPIALASGATIVLVCTTSDNAAAIAECNSEGGSIVPRVNGISGAEHTYKFTAQNDTYVMVSYNKNYSNSVSIYGKKSNVMLDERIDNLNNKIEDLHDGLQFLSSFSKITCIGDSITKGIVYTSAVDVRIAAKPYPDMLKVLTGTETAKYAEGGYSASDWWSHYSSIFTDNRGLYIVYLGTNGGLTDTIETDCSGTDPADFASTNTGCYGKILQTIANNGDKAILVHCKHGGGGDLETTNDVITAFGTRYSFPVIDISGDSTKAIYHYWPNGEGSNPVHYNDYGYIWLASDICHQVDDLTDTQKLSIF